MFGLLDALARVPPDLCEYCLPGCPCILHSCEDEEMLPEPILVTIPGKPVAKARPRRGAGGHFYSPTARIEDDLAWEFVKHRGHFKDQLVIVEIVFCVNRRSRADEDNLSKTYLDVMKKAGVYDDDWQVFKSSKGKRVVDYGQERTIVRVRAIPTETALRLRPLSQRHRR